MTTVRRIADLPRGVGVSPADQITIWQNGRTRWTDLAEVLRFVAAPAKGDKGETGPQGPIGPQGPKGDTVISTPGGDVDLSAYAMKNAPTLTNPTMVGSTSLSNDSSMVMGNNQIFVKSVYDPVSTRGRIDISRPTPVAAEYADINMRRDTTSIDGRGAGFGGVSTMLRIDNKIGPTDLSQWNILSIVEANGAGAGQHVAGYFQTTRTANVAAFGACFEVKDRVSNPTAGMVNTEFGMTGNGPCGNTQRINVNIVYGAADIYQAGDHEITAGIDVSAPFGQASWVPGTSFGSDVSTSTGRAILLAGLRMQGNVVNCIDLSKVNPNLNYQGSTAAGVRHPTGLVDTWDSGGAFGFGINEMIVRMPGTGLRPGKLFPAGYDFALRVNVANGGTALIPCIYE